MDRPLISYLVVTYNQEPYIREALESAFAQTYSPLEIIVSDDCSKDRTFAIAEEMAAAYKGPHTIKLNRNSPNVGIGANINRAMELCKGELVVGAAGDDVSLPNRAEVTYEVWEKSGRKATSIFSSYTAMTGEGIVLGVGGLKGDPTSIRPFERLEGELFNFLSTKGPAVNGCTHAWSPELFRYFGPLTSDLEDLVLSFRTLAIGQLFYIREPLVRYRRHDCNVSFFAEKDDTTSFEHREKRLRWVDEKSVIAYENMLADVDRLCAKNRISSADGDRLKAEGQRVARHYTMEKQMMDGSLFERLRALAGSACKGDVKSTMRFMPRALPRRVYRALYLMRDKWKSSARGRNAPVLERAK